MSAPISSPANPRVKALVRLRTSRRERDDTGSFVIEGERELARAVAGGIEIAEVYYSGTAGAAAAAETETAGFEMSEAAFAKASYRDAATGVLAVARQFPLGLDRIALAGAPLLLVAEAVEKPGNLGAMLRTAAAAGAGGVVVANPVADVFNPNVVRASLGALFLLPVAVAAPTSVRSFLDEAGVGWHAASVHGRRPYWDADLTAAAAVVVGSEQSGLSPGWLADPERTVVIPTPGPVASLNASVAAALLLFEAVRQRNPRAAGRDA